MPYHYGKMSKKKPAKKGKKKKPSMNRKMKKSKSMYG